METLLDRLHLVADLGSRPASSPLLAPGRTAELTLGAAPFGLLGEVSPAVRSEFGLRAACSAAELTFDLLIGRAVLVPQYRHLPPFPSVARDLSLVVPADLPWSELSEAARSAAGSTLESIEYLDVFSGADIPPDRHSLHFGLRFRHPERTLTSEEVEKAVKSVVDSCGARFGATLRT